MTRSNRILKTDIFAESSYLEESRLLSHIRSRDEIRQKRQPGRGERERERKEKKTNEHSSDLLRTSLKANENAAKTQNIKR